MRNWTCRATRPGTPPEMSPRKASVSRSLHSARASARYGRETTIEDDSVLRHSGVPISASTLLAVPFPRSRAQFSSALEGTRPVVRFTPAASDAVCTAAESLDGATTNREANSASGITRRSSGER